MPARPGQGALAADGDTFVGVGKGDRVMSSGRCHTAGPVAAFATKAILHVAVPWFGSNVPTVIDSSGVGLTTNLTVRTGKTD